LFVGLMGENHLPGSSLGETEQAILATQFEALARRRSLTSTRTPTRIAGHHLNGTTLAQIIERNTDITNLQPDVFFLLQHPGRRRPHHDVHTMLKRRWRQSPTRG